MNQVRRLRHAKGWTQEQLAQAAGCRRSFISMIESGKANPTQRQLEAIARALGVPLAHLFLEDGGSDPSPSMTGCAS